MNIEELRDYCLAVKGATEGFPFGKDILVFKIMEKMFAYIALSPRDGVLRVNLKCDPESSVELRDKYAGVGEGHYSGTQLWNSVAIESDVPDTIIRELIDHSVSEVVKRLTKLKREEYLKL